MAGPLTTPILDVLLRPEDANDGPFWNEIREGHYDREGYGISLREWAVLFEYKPYQVVEQTDVGGYWVSTVWLGLDHSFGHGAPRIFESMVFEAEVSYKKPTEFFPEGYWYRRDYDQLRWCTEIEAQHGHWRLVEEVRLVSRAFDPDWLPTLGEQP